MNLEELNTLAWDLSNDQTKDGKGIHFPNMTQYVNLAQQEWILKVGYPETTAAVRLVPHQLEYTMPSSLSRILRAYFRGKPVSLMKEADLDVLHSRSPMQQYPGMLVTPFGRAPVALEQNVLEASRIGLHTRWQEEKGELSALVFPSKTARTFRVYPVPEVFQYSSGEATEYGGIDSFSLDPVLAQVGGAGGVDAVTHTADFGEITSVTVSSGTLNFRYQFEEGATDDVFLADSLRLVGLMRPPALVNNTDIPIIDEEYHEALVHGALAKAYQRSNDAKNRTKAKDHNTQFLDYVRLASQEETVESAENATTSRIDIA